MPKAAAVQPHNATTSILKPPPAQPHRSVRSAAAAAASARPTRDFIREHQAVPFNRQAARKVYQPGTYERHPPHKCDHILKSRPIHLKLKSATELKEMCTIVSHDGQRKLLVPSTTINVYPTIMSSDEMGRIRDQSTIVTKQMAQQRLDAAEAEKQRLERECEERKQRLRELDKKKQRAATATARRGDGCGDQPAELSEEEDGPKRVMERAFVAKQEQTEEVKRANRLIMAAKCHVIRDAQVAEKNELSRELREENLRLERIMDADRERALREEERERERLALANAEYGHKIRNQLREREQLKLLESERIAAEAAAMAQGQISITLDLIEKEKERREETLRLRKDLQRANELNDRFKALAFEEERIADMKAAEFLRQKQERDRERKEELRQVAAMKQRDRDRMLAYQSKLLERKSNEDDVKLRRAQEEKEREFRRKEKEAAALRRQRTKELEQARAQQTASTQRERALQIVRDEMAFRSTVNKLEQQALREEEEQQRRHVNKQKYRVDVMRQIKDKELLRREQKRLDRLEHCKWLESERQRERDIKAVIQAKMATLDEANIPDKFIEEVRRKMVLPDKIAPIK